MNIKTIYLLTILFLNAVFSFAEEKKAIQSQLNEATLFFQGAELTHTANASLQKGENEVWIEGLSSSIDKNSLRIKSSGGTIISAYEYSADFLSERKHTPIEEKLQDSIEFYQKKLELVQVETNINQQMIGLLQEGISKNVSGSESGMPIDELVKTIDYYKTKLTELKTTSISNREKTILNEMILGRLQAQLTQEKLKKNKASGILKIKLTAHLAITSQFTITYYTPSAGWTLFYEINIETTEQPIKIVSKAKVRQTTGIDWEKVKLTLSTSTPSNGKMAPLFQAWFLNFQESNLPLQRKGIDFAFVAATQNSYSYTANTSSTSETQAFQKKTNHESKIDKDDFPYLYIIDGMLVDEGTFASIDPKEIKSKIFLDEAQANEQYGNNVAGVWVLELISSLDEYVTLENNALNLSYAIDLPYSISTNGKEQNIELNTQEVTANYQYYCAPKLDPATYLLAEITNPEKLNLLNGKANITYDGTYVGETMISATSTHEKLTLSLGTDKRVAVKREKMQDFSSKKFLNNDIEQSFTYKLTVRNNHNKPIKMTLKDQYPISTQKDIKVDLLEETTKPSFNVESVGVLTWEQEFKAGEIQEYRNSYKIKYPKNEQLNLE